MAYTAKHRFVPMSARKVRLVLDMIRGRSLTEAMSATQFSPKRAAHYISKVLKSAQANALDKGASSLGNLVVKAAFADEGPTRKKYRCRARGSASPIMARSTHITITLAPNSQAEG